MRRSSRSSDAFELLSFASFVVLEPIENVLAFDLAVLGELSGDLLDL